MTEVVRTQPETDAPAFTPGPWEFVTSEWYGFSAIWNPDTRQEVLVTGGRNDGDHPITWMGEELSEADRCLISAAPDLYEALQNLLGFSGSPKSMEFEMAKDEARAALAKAEAKHD